jgi:hypothetical protein
LQTRGATFIPTGSAAGYMLVFWPQVGVADAENGGGDAGVSSSGRSA